jgi:hypothetical protein
MSVPKLILVAVLGLLGGVQMLGLFARFHPKSVFIEEGEAFPTIIRMLTGDELALEGRSCAVLYICYVDCAACNALARERNTLVPGDETRIPLWVIVDSVDRATEFARSHGLAANRVAFVDPSELADRFFPQLFNVPATPLRVLLGPGGIVEDISLSHEWPPDHDVSETCR